MARARLNSSNTQAEELPKAKITRASLANVFVLLSYLKPYRLKYFFGLAFLLFSGLALLYFPKAMGELIDAAELTKPGTALKNVDSIALILLGVLLLQAVFSFFRIVWFVEVAEKALADIRKDTYLKLITLPMDFFAKRRVGELNSRISADLSQIQDSITTTIAELLRQMILLIGGTIALSFVSGKLTLMMLAVFPVMVVIAVIFGRYIRKISRLAQDQLANSNTIVEETLQGIANVKAFSNEPYEANRYKNSVNEVVKLAMRGATFRGGFASFIIFCLFGAIVSVVWYGVKLVQAGEISVGDLTSFILYATFVGGAMGSFADLYANLQKTIGATERVLEILKEENEPVLLTQNSIEVEHKLNGSIDFENVSFSYAGRKDTEVLHSISFSAAAGERVAIVGPSGAGKSTIASLLLRFYEPNSGYLKFDFKDSKTYSLNDIRSQVAIVPQDVLLFGGTISENILYGKIGSSNAEMMEAARRANALEFIERFPEGFETIVGERGIKLSGGQRQRIAIARALLKNPAILILDEATSSLDSESERLVQEALEELMKNRTSIIIAHRLATIREADKIVVLDSGKVVEIGNHETLLQNENGLYRYLSRLQFEV